MKFYYQYRTSDNVRHDGEIKAASREAAFTALKAQGIRPGYMEEAPGFFNKLLGKGKRWMAIAALGLISLALLVYIFAWQSKQADMSVDDGRSPIDRRQLLGDAAILEQGISNDWRGVFTRRSDRFLAKYLQPGVAVPSIDKPMLEDVCEELKETMGESVNVDDSDMDEVRQVKRIVAGMREELVDFVNDGGTVEKYVESLMQRQMYEVQMRRRVQMELKAMRNLKTYDEYVKEWKRKNLELRAVGIALVPLDEEM